MSKRRQIAEANLPLFDLPLQQSDDAAPATSGTEERSAAPEPGTLAAPVPAPAPPARQAAQPTESSETQPAAAGPPRRAPAEPRPSPEPEQSPLFSADDLEPAAEAHEPWPEEMLGDDAPLVQDRLLSGLADLALLLVGVGSMVLGTQLMGVRVTLEHWPPFLLFGVLLSFPYAVIPLAFWGHTPGMAWVGHGARSVDGEPLTFGQTVRRWLGALLTLALAGLPLLLTWRGGRSAADRLSDSLTFQRP